MRNERQPRSTKRIGELLVERGLIGPAQLDQALARQRSTGEFLGAILIGMRAISEQALLEAMSLQFGIPHEPLRPSQVDWTVARQFPPSALAEGNAFPIRADANAVTVAIANPLDAWTLSLLEGAASRRAVRPVLVLASELQAVVREHQRQTLRAIEARLNGESHGA